MRGREGRRALGAVVTLGANIAVVLGACVYADPRSRAQDSGREDSGREDSSIDECLYDPRTGAEDASAPRCTSSSALNWVNETGKIPGDQVRSHAAAAGFPEGVLFLGGEIGPRAKARAGDAYFFLAGRSVWVKVAAPDLVPGRSSTSIVYDEANARFVVFSGLGAAGTLPGETWALTDATTAAAAWTRIVDESPDGPDKRYGHRMVYIPTRQSILMVAGATGAYGRPDPLVADTWELRANTWTPICGAGGAPACPFPRRFLHGLAYDPLRDRVVMFGGQAYTQQLVADTWEYDAAARTWKCTPTDPVKSPAPRYMHGMAWHPARKAVILHGGSVSGLPVNDSWEWNGACWSELPRALDPPKYSGRAFAYSAAHGGVVAIGGYRADVDTIVSDISYGQ